MKNALKPLCMFALMMLLSGCLYGQDLQSLEQKYASLSEKLQKEDSILSMLKSSLDERARQIDYEKKKADADNNRITQLMANSINLSSQVEAQQKKVHNIFTELETVKRSLNRSYEENLEKLQARRKSSKNSQEINSLDSEIMLLMGKKLIVIPYLPRLSTDPGRIKSLDVKSLEGADKNIYAGYLKTALSETEAQLREVNGIYEETEQVVKLQKKTRKFLQEAETERGMHPAGRVSFQTNSRGTSNNDIPAYTDKAGQVSADKNTVDMIQSHALLYSQLNPERSSEILQNLKTILDTSGKKFSLNGYFNMLKDLKKSLEEYRSMLISKIGQDR